MFSFYVFFETAKYAKIPHIRKSWGEFSVANHTLTEIGQALGENQIVQF